MSKMRFVSITEKSSFPSIEGFDCGSLALNAFLRRYAKQNDEKGIGKTFLGLEGDKVVGFFTLAPTQIEFEDISSAAAKRLPRCPMPAIRIARLGVNKADQDQGIGRLLLREAFIKIVSASEITGVFFVLVDTKETSHGFYERFGFRALASCPSTYFLAVSTIKKAMKPWRGDSSSSGRIDLRLFILAQRPFFPYLLARPPGRKLYFCLIAAGGPPFWRTIGRGPTPYVSSTDLPTSGKMTDPVTFIAWRSPLRSPLPGRLLQPPDCQGHLQIMVAPPSLFRDYPIYYLTFAARNTELFEKARSSRLSSPFCLLYNL